MGVYKLSQVAPQVQEDLELVENLQDAFDPLKTYPVGSLVLYQAFIWRCIKAVTAPGDWTGGLNWVKITLKDLQDLKQDVLTSTSVAEGNVKEVIGFNELNDLVRDTVRVPYVEDETLKF